MSKKKNVAFADDRISAAAFALRLLVLPVWKTRYRTWSCAVLLQSPLCYGARLYEGDNYDDEDFGSMAWAGDDPAVWDQVCGLVKAAFGDEAAQSLAVDEKTTDKTVPDQKCVYVLEDGRWRDQHPRFGQEASVHYRIPGVHPDDDVWESADADVFVKVTDDEDNRWYVADLHIDFGGGGTAAYLMIPSDIAKKSLRRAAVVPDVEVQEAVRDFSGLCCFPGQSTGRNVRRLFCCRVPLAPSLPECGLMGSLPTSPMAKLSKRSWGALFSET